jgi:hypothetical protein
MFKDIKAYSTASAEAAGAPAASGSNFATVDGLHRNQGVSRLVEFRLGGTPATTGSPTAVLLDIYRYNKLTVSVDYLATWTILPADITSGKVPPLILETWGNDLMTKLSFTGGTSPTFTGTPQGRALE